MIDSQHQNIKETVELDAQLASLHEVEIFLQGLLDISHLGQAAFLDLKLVIEEVFTNVIKYGFKNQQASKIIIQLSVDDKAVEVTIIDKGTAFNPLTSIDPDLEIPPEERAPGGLGIYLVKQLMDQVTYQRIENRNVLTLKKYIC